METKISYVYELLSGEPLEAFKNLSPSQLSSVDEIRLRVMRPMSLSVGAEDVITDATARPEDIEHTFKSAFSYSMHSYSKELSHGYITTRGGNRVGICGTAVNGNSEGVETLKYISSINIRIAREIKGSADGIIEQCFKGGRLCSVLLIGPPSSGKTTVLRDLCRQLGDRYKISLIDELNEISATHRNAAQNDVGRLTDIFVSYPKHVGISTAVRVMSPRAVIADEIGSRADADALGYALHSGVKLITAVHGESIGDVRRKPALAELFAERAFDFAVILDSSRRLKVEKID